MLAYFLVYLKPRTINDRTFGRCFEIMLLNENKHITMVDINFKQSIYIYINIPFRFWELHTRSKLQANVNEDLFMEVNYEIHKKNYGKKCKKYSNNYYQSFDRCQTLDQAKRIIEKFNCTVPFLCSFWRVWNLSWGSSRKGEQTLSANSSKLFMP